MGAPVAQAAAAADAGPKLVAVGKGLKAAPAEVWLRVAVPTQLTWQSLAHASNLSRALSPQLSQLAPHLKLLDLSNNALEASSQALPVHACPAQPATRLAGPECFSLWQHAQLVKAGACAQCAHRAA